jgi:hypothetical protein
VLLKVPSARPVGQGGPQSAAQLAGVSAQSQAPLPQDPEPQAAQLPALHQELGPHCDAVVQL